MEYVRNRTKREFIKKDDDDDKIWKMQSETTFSGIRISYDKYDCYTIKQNEILVGIPIYRGISIIELSKLLKYETWFDKIQSYFRKEIIPLHYMYADGFVISVRRNDFSKAFFKKNGLFDFSNLNRGKELFRQKIKKF